MHNGFARLLLLVLFSGCVGKQPTGPPETPPNIILIYADDLGWRDLGVQGSDFYETPNIDRLAAEGIRFTDAYANAPNCAPSRASLMTGLYTPRHGVYTVGSAFRGQSRDRALIPVENRTDLALETETIAELLRDAGYSTGHLGKWHLGGDGSSALDHGFDWSVAGSALGHPPSYFYPYTRGNSSLPDIGTAGIEGEYLTDRLTDEAIGFMERQGDDPFFLYFSHYAVHTPLQAKSELTERYEAKQPSNGQGNPTYAAMVQSLDESVGRILETLRRLGIEERTVVIFHSDNGGYGPATSMQPLRGSKGMLYEGGIREPLIVKWPGRTIGGSVSDATVIGSDLFPTLLEIAGIHTRENLNLDGRSLVPELTQDPVEDERTLFWHFPAYLEADRSVPGPWRTTPASAVRRGRYKLIHFFEGARTELYDLDTDIGESRDLSQEVPEKTAELFDALNTWWEQTGAFIPSEENPEFKQ